MDNLVSIFDDTRAWIHFMYYPLFAQPPPAYLSPAYLETTLLAPHATSVQPIERLIGGLAAWRNERNERESPFACANTLKRTWSFSVQTNSKLYYLWFFFFLFFYYLFFRCGFLEKWLITYNSSQFASMPPFIFFKTFEILVENLYCGVLFFNFVSLNNFIF